MTKKADIGSKRLISLSTQAWLEWVTSIPNIQSREIIASEFQWISRESDVIIRAYTEKYELPVYPVLINILPPKSPIQILDTYSSQFKGLDISNN